MDERDPISQRIEELDRLADQVLGPIDHMRQDCSWTDPRRSEDYMKILLTAAAKAAEQYANKKEGIPPHVRSAVRSKPDRERLRRLSEGLIGVIVAPAALSKKCAAAVVGSWKIGVATLGLAASIGTTIVVTHSLIAATRSERAAEAVLVTDNSASSSGMTVAGNFEMAFFDSTTSELFADGLTLDQRQLQRVKDSMPTDTVGSLIPSSITDNPEFRAWPISNDAAGPTNNAVGDNVAAPEPNTLFLVGIVCIGTRLYFSLRSRRRRNVS